MVWVSPLLWDKFQQSLHDFFGIKIYLQAQDGCHKRMGCCLSFLPRKSHSLICGSKKIFNCDLFLLLHQKMIYETLYQIFCLIIHSIRQNTPNISWIMHSYVQTFSHPLSYDEILAGLFREFPGKSSFPTARLRASVSSISSEVWIPNWP